MGFPGGAVEVGAVVPGLKTEAAGLRVEVEVLVAVGAGEDGLVFILVVVSVNFWRVGGEGVGGGGNGSGRVALRTMRCVNGMDDAVLSAALTGRGILTSQSGQRVKAIVANPVVPVSAPGTKDPNEQKTLDA